MIIVISIIRIYQHILVVISFKFLLQAKMICCIDAKDGKEFKDQVASYGALDAGDLIGLERDI